MLSFRTIIQRVLPLAAVFVFITATGRAASLSPSLDKMLTDRPYSDSIVSVVVFLENESGSMKAGKAASMSGLSFRAKHEKVIEILQTENQSATASLKKNIEKIYQNANIREFWIAPAMALNIPISKISELSSLPGIASVVEDAPVELIEPVESKPITAKAGTVHSHLTSLNIPALWSRGLTGRGRLVCSFDTGVEGSHPALYSKWRGNYAASSAAWFAPSSSETFPFDASGHGTHTMGLMVGSYGVDSFGVAPDAEWMTAAVIDQGQTLSRTISDILAAFQWAVDPDGNPATVDDMPDVILNSWGVPTSIFEPCNATFDQAIDNVEAAGIVTIFAAGNEGPNPKSLRLPANRAASPLNTIAVGAINDATDIIADFSSRGPSSCDESKIKPELVAPGVGIYSCAKGGGFILKSGTSMAAPLIAGMVALLRQYNPEATVEEIKTAIIESARDLGLPGEDNTYGYGLPDAEAALSFMPPPPFPQLSISNQIIGGDGFADLGENFDFYVEFEHISGYTQNLEAYLDCDVEGVEIINNYALYILDEKSQYSTNANPYVIRFDEPLVNGQMIPFTMRLYLPWDTIGDTIDLQIMAGRAFDGNIVTHTTSQIDFSVTDRAQYGMGTGSIYPVGGDGFRYEGSDNLLHEAGIIVGRNSLQISSSIRDSLGQAYNSEFRPSQPLTTIYPDFDGGFKSTTVMTDTQSGIMIPITVSQSISSYNDPGDENFLIFRYTLINNSNSNISGLYFGFVTDFDLSAAGDQLGMDTKDNLLYQTGGPNAIGILPLCDYNGYLSVVNDTDKSGFTAQQKYNFISLPGNNINDSLAGDYMTVVSFGPYYIPPYSSKDIALALIAGENIEALQLSTKRVFDRFNSSTAVDDDILILPGQFELFQNYPNPFNPSTKISFNLDRAAFVKLTVHNILGREITTLSEGFMSPGHYDFEWDGTDKFGKGVASGVYFYKLQNDVTSQTKKMLLLK